MKKTVLIIAGALGCAILLLLVFSLYLRQTQGALLTHAPAHGVSIVFEIDPIRVKENTNIMATMKEALRRRAYQAGVRIYWEPISETQFRVSANIKALRAAAFTKAFMRGGVLGFRLVHPESDDLIKQDLIPPGYIVLQHSVSAPDGKPLTEKLLVKRKPEPGLDGDVVKHAWADRNRLGEPEIRFEMEPAAARAFAGVTRDNIGERLAILLDGELYSAPRIQSPIENGAGVITGSFTVEEAVALANAMQSTLPAPIKVLETKEF